MPVPRPSTRYPLRYLSFKLLSPPKPLSNLRHDTRWRRERCHVHVDRDPVPVPRLLRVEDALPDRGEGVTHLGRVLLRVEAARLGDPEGRLALEADRLVDRLHIVVD